MNAVNKIAAWDEPFFCVAREYGIPAVPGTGVATRQIQDGQSIPVDGVKGIVELR